MNGTTLQKYAYSYGKIESGSVNTAKNTGQLAQVDSWIGTDQQYRQQYQYDTLGRLTDSTEKYGTSLASTAYDLKYSYDTFGNRFQKAADNTGNTAIAQKWVETGDIDPATNRFIATGATPTTYDASGNITADPKFRNLTYGYDANGRQNFAASSGGSGPSNAIYDAAGQRVANKVGGVLNLMVYDAGGKLVAEYGATAPGTANLQYITSNYQGSTSVVTDNSSEVVSRHDYLPFGEEIGAGVGSRSTGKFFSQPDSVRQRYAGMETDDATGMATTLWRKDDNLSGRWTSPDPYTGSLSIVNPQSFNRYTYCDNDPVNKTDSSGLMAYSGADVGIEGFGGFGGEPGFDDPHFGGPQIIENGMEGFPDRVSGTPKDGPIVEIGGSSTGDGTSGGESSTDENSTVAHRDKEDPEDDWSPGPENSCPPLSLCSNEGGSAPKHPDMNLVYVDPTITITTEDPGPDDKADKPDDTTESRVLVKTTVTGLHGEPIPFSLITTYRDGSTDPPTVYGIIWDKAKAGNGYIIETVPGAVGTEKNVYTANISAAGSQRTQVAYTVVNAAGLISVEQTYQPTLGQHVLLSYPVLPRGHQ